MSGPKTSHVIRILKSKHKIGLEINVKIKLRQILGSTLHFGNGGFRVK